MMTAFIQRAVGRPTEIKAHGIVRVAGMVQTIFTLSQSLLVG
jgi:hypothetical protein